MPTLRGHAGGDRQTTRMPTGRGHGPQNFALRWTYRLASRGIRRSSATRITRLIPFNQAAGAIRSQTAEHAGLGLVDGVDVIPSSAATSAAGRRRSSLPKRLPGGRLEIGPEHLQAPCSTSQVSSVPVPLGSTATGPAGKSWIRSWWADPPSACGRCRALEMIAQLVDGDPPQPAAKRAALGLVAKPIQRAGHR